MFNYKGNLLKNLLKSAVFRYSFNYSCYFTYWWSVYDSCYFASVAIWLILEWLFIAVLFMFRMLIYEILADISVLILMFLVFYVPIGLSLWLLANLKGDRYFSESLNCVFETLLWKLS